MSNRGLLLGDVGHGRLSAAKDWQHAGTSPARTRNQQAEHLHLSALCSAQKGRRRLRRRHRLEAQQRASVAAGHHATSPPALTARPERPGLGACHRVSGWPSFTCKPRVVWPSTSCLLLTLHFNSTGEKKGPRARLLYSPARWHKPGCTKHLGVLTCPSPASLTHPARPRWRSQCFAKPYLLIFL